jgi:eukaryotic-like serine/threonine-protein kinase
MAEQRLVAERYELRESLGAGGMGRVWLARDEILRRDVAVKEVLLPIGLTDAEREELCVRTMREAQAAARLSHPNVVQIYDVVEEHERPWIVMEYIRSRSLYEVIKTDGPLEPRRAAEIGLAVLAALRAAHSAGVLHRDVKPGNVLLADDGRVVLTDFGLATFSGGEGAVTRPGLILGSVQYVAPERAKDGTSSPESDLWALGATLYAAVEGRSPYARTTSMATLTALATQPPDPVQRAGPLRPVLAGLLRRNPRARMRAEEVHRHLVRILTDDARLRLRFPPRHRQSRGGPPTPVGPPGASSPAGVLAAGVSSPAVALPTVGASPVVGPPVVAGSPAAGMAGPVVPGAVDAGAVPTAAGGEAGGAIGVVADPVRANAMTVVLASGSPRTRSEGEMLTPARVAHPVRRLAIGTAAILVASTAALLALKAASANRSGAPPAVPAPTTAAAVSPCASLPVPAAFPGPAVVPTVVPTITPATISADRFAYGPGFTEVKDTSGFRISLPTNFRREKADGSMACFTSADIVVGVDQWPAGTASPLEVLTQEASDAASRLSGYHKARLVPVDCRPGETCAEWEFTYGQVTTLKRVRIRDVLAPTGQMYAIIWQDSAYDWSESRIYVVMFSFRPAWPGRAEPEPSGG